MRTTKRKVSTRFPWHAPRRGARRSRHDPENAKYAARAGPAIQPPIVSVIVPVYNDKERLLLCFEALRRQDFPADQFEIIVIDNGSSLEQRPDLPSIPNLLMLHETRPGSYSARNTGLARARGEVIAFTDSDCIPAGDWLAAGTTALESTGADLVAGAIDVFARNPARPTPTEAFDIVHGFPQERFVTKDRFGPTANLFVRRKVFDAVGPFSENSTSGGDLEFGRRALAGGFRLVFSEDVRVRHPARHDHSEMKKKIIRIRQGHHLHKGITWGEVFRGMFPVRPAGKILLHTGLKRWHRVKGVGGLIAYYWTSTGEALRLKLGGRIRPGAR